MRWLGYPICVIALGLSAVVGCERDVVPLTTPEPPPPPEPVVSVDLELSTSEARTGDTVRVTGSVILSGDGAAYLVPRDCGEVVHFLVLDEQGNYFSLTPPSHQMCATLLGVKFQAGEGSQSSAQFSGTVWSNEVAQLLPPGEYMVVALVKFRIDPSGGDCHVVTAMQELRWN